ncbi:deleted in malignant brain tumors 1 protein-like [Lytechinus variegatus]|uniref:deleted in malignant brain tumors 1 protein-like n=1 Tax=Lytechinus variegatus TaxID=7654 RepID=UPI001BB10750|nr:deleted in malignant brain tumors 1 protein-like [Lytechinus variegatus]
MPNFTLNSPYFYQPSTDAYVVCLWHVYASSGNKVEITWLEVDTPSNWLYLYDYPSYTNYIISYLRGDFDDDISPVVSSHGGWTIQHYDSYSGNNGRGFLARFSQRDTQYYSSSASCGGTIPLTQSSPNATFSTPYYYQTSLANVVMDCWWYISSPSGKQVHLTVLDMLTGINEKIEIYDYPTSSPSSYRVSELSGQLKSPVNVVSSRGGVTVEYDDFGSANNGPGFLFEAKIIDELPSDISGSCGGEIHLSTSIPRVSITTPLYYQGSSANVLIDCWWYVTSPSGKEVELSVHDMHTKNEYVRIFDHKSDIYMYSQNQISHLRGNVSDSTVVSTRGGFSIEFDDTSSTGNGRGFAMDVALTDELSWDSEGIDSCGQTVHLDDSSPSISFQTPTYPVEVANDDYTCFWYFTCPYGYRISLLFNDFDTFSGSRLYVYDNDYFYSTNLLAAISASSLPGTAPIQSSSNRLTLHYDDADWSDITNQRGIKANAYIIPLEDPAWDNMEPMSSCGSAIKLTDQDSSIQLSTPDYPYVSGNYYACSWFIQCPSQTAVRIDFNDFGIDSSGYIRVHDGPNTAYSVIQHSTGSNTPSSTVSSSNTMTVYYSNNFGTSGKGASFGISCVFEVDVECDSSSMTVYLDRRLLANGTQSEDIHFENVHDDGCTGRDHNNNQIVLYTRYNRCSTRLKETDTKIIYSNMVTYHTPRPILGTVITRENILKIPVACELDRHRLLGDSFVPKTGEIVFNETGYGDFSLRLDRYADATFDEFADDNEGEIILGEHLYFAVNLTSVAGLSVFIENCWATPSYYPNDQKSYNFLTNGCPDDPTMAMLHSSDPSFAKFVIDAFTFIDENPQVFLHCEVLVCNDEPLSRCAQGCQSRFRRGSRHTRGTSSTPHLISNGPLSTVHSSLTAESHDDAVVSAESGVLIGLFACITCLIVAMVAVVLYMMPKRRMLQHKYHLVNDSNEDDE